MGAPLGRPSAAHQLQGPYRIFRWCPRPLALRRGHVRRGILPKHRGGPRRGQGGSRGGGQGQAEEEAKAKAEEEAKAKAEEEAKDKAEEEAKDKAEEEAQDKAVNPEEEAKLQAGWAAAKARAMSRVSRLVQKKPAMGKAEEDSPSKEDPPGELPQQKPDMGKAEEDSPSKEDSPGEPSEELKPEEPAEDLKPEEAVAKAEEAVAKAKAKAKAKAAPTVKQLQLPPTVKMRTIRASLQSYIQIWDAEEQRWVLLVSISKKMSPDHAALIMKITLEIKDGTGCIGDKEAAVRRRDFLVAYGF